MVYKVLGNGLVCPELKRNNRVCSHAVQNNKLFLLSTILMINELL